MFHRIDKLRTTNERTHGQRETLCNRRDKSRINRRMQLFPERVRVSTEIVETMQVTNSPDLSATFSGGSRTVRYEPAYLPTASQRFIPVCHLGTSERRHGSA